MTKQYQKKKPRCSHFITKKGKQFKCKNTAIDGTSFCRKHTLPIDNSIGKCCFCGGDCNPCSQACGRCARDLTYHCIYGNVF